MTPGKAGDSLVVVGVRVCHEWAMRPWKGRQNTGAKITGEARHMIGTSEYVLEMFV